ncbi:MAG: valine--tRNA ligase [Candidatus Harrisonbacteria bacterium RIFCSPHIGHO2_01_FULL_44_13]|uniref:Valine--tRNA ligase n=1 Tax=Candidatus Harrisonbacteria bacterium RIFCSPLOWO2_01_FULL_44_18 TaxID=1798407 RepID=A0A1G1ZPQ7_9BACT|nr:MAG: valine--tRNA ligase [Candidatus Harrisonbacteria bacterium RIFCSPHIGHO2_01_FULL_44_13]OGY66146.1 MAG: valine--tRNA ligase [Candidatus Harrisonbacteria bacterium RIFCSPLOWO2_01_FULL_44_18]
MKPYNEVFSFGYKSYNNKMTEELSKAYDPKVTEEKIYKLWQESGYFNPDNFANLKNLKLKTKNYSIHLPPPNVTGSLHMGHALNATIADILIRYHRMKGYKTVWFPGIDHAGIATQNVVEKQLKKEGLSRWDLGREKFIEKVWEWKEKYGGIILEQLKRLGASCDWSRARFTMDPDYANWVKKAFIHYCEKGLIYRGKRVVSWCPRCQTSLSDLEIEYKPEKAKLWYIRYPLKTQIKTDDDRPRGKSPRSPLRSAESAFVVVATTRPESMLGDAAVAVNPKDKRYKKLIGESVNLLLVGREIPIIADDAIDMNFGTGAVKVTPAHDLLDAEIAERHGLPFYQVIDERGRMTVGAGKDFEGLKVLEAREKVVAKLQELGLIEKIEDYQHNLAVCYRCGATLEPMLSDQWFLKMSELAEKTLKPVKSGKVKIIPQNFEKILFSWLENIKDWCISRQIWWGHQIPVYFCKQAQTDPSTSAEHGAGHSADYTRTDAEKFIVATEKPEQCPFCKECEMEQSQDVLDTWFSSALWPLAGLSEKDVEDFYPSNVLITARDIINLWVARMIFSGLEFVKKEPFPEVLIHATILTKEGKRMSKSLGTGIDPLELIEKYGADATRFGIIWQAMGTQDIHWDETAVMAGKKFANKLWNIARYVRSVRDDRDENVSIERSDRSPNIEHVDDKPILEKLRIIETEVRANIESYELGPALHKIYDFIWHEFADKYIEASKKRDDEEVKKVLLALLLGSLKILHPFMPFITEEIYQILPTENKKLLMIERWN